MKEENYESDSRPSEEESVVLSIKDSESEVNAEKINNSIKIVSEI